METISKVIIYWSEEDAAFIAEAPELPGCAADGPSQRAALDNLDVITEEWIATATELGRQIPQPMDGRCLREAVLGR